MIAAVELRTDPTAVQLPAAAEPEHTARCAPNQKNPPVIYVEDFEDGLAGWTLTNQGVFSGWPGTNWAADRRCPVAAPARRPSRADPSRATATAAPATSPA